MRGLCYHNARAIPIQAEKSQTAITPKAPGCDLPPPGLGTHTERDRGARATVARMRQSGTAGGRADGSRCYNLLQLPGNESRKRRSYVYRAITSDDYGRSP